MQHLRSKGALGTSGRVILAVQECWRITRNPGGNDATLGGLRIDGERSRARRVRGSHGLGNGLVNCDRGFLGRN